MKRPTPPATRPTLALGLSICAACSSPPPPAQVERAEQPIATASAEAIKEIPAVDRARYPDSVAYLYQGPLSKILWMQNIPPFTRMEELEPYLHEVAARGVSGEVVASSMQTVTPIPADPELEDLARSASQSTLLMAQYSNVAHDYSKALWENVSQYNGSPQRLAEIAGAASRVEAALQVMGEIAPVAPIPPPAPNHRPALRDGTYFTETVLIGKRRYLASAAEALQRAITAHDPEAYDGAFSDVYAAQLDPAIRDEARAALAVSHQEALLTGQPLDRVILRYVLQGGEIAVALGVEQLRLINRVALRWHAPAASREAMILALLLVAEDRRQGHSDASFSCFKVWEHIHDPSWLVTEYLRLTGGGDAADALAMVAEIINGMGAL
jgi:hypothetical protein